MIINLFDFHRHWPWCLHTLIYIYCTREPNVRNDEKSSEKKNSPGNRHPWISRKPTFLRRCNNYVTREALTARGFGVVYLRYATNESEKSRRRRFGSGLDDDGENHERSNRSRSSRKYRRADKGRFNGRSSVENHASGASCLPRVGNNESARLHTLVM